MNANGRIDGVCEECAAPQFDDVPEFDMLMHIEYLHALLREAESELRHMARQRNRESEPKEEC